MGTSHCWECGWPKPLHLGNCGSKGRKVRLIAFCGKANVGKDTAAMYLVRRHNYVKYGFADPIKRGLNATFGWTMSQWIERGWKETADLQLGFSPRKAAQTFGTEWGRQMLRDDIWILLADMFYSALDDCGAAGMVISDLRYDNEAAWVKKVGGSIIQLERQVEDVRPHSSEQGVNLGYIDAFIKNEGTLSDLFDAVEEFHATQTPLAS